MVADKKYITKLYLENENILNKASWEAHLTFNRVIEFDDIKSQSNEIFMETIIKYDPSIAKFDTYLVHRLKKLYKYCARSAIRNYYSLDAMIELNLDMPETEYRFDQFKEVIYKVDAEMYLSPNARRILEFMLSRIWETWDSNNTNIKKFGYQNVLRWFKYMHNWEPSEIRKAWEELSRWWDT